MTSAYMQKIVQPRAITFNKRTAKQLSRKRQWKYFQDIIYSANVT